MVSAAVLVSVDLLYAFIPAWATDQGIPIETVGMLLTVRAAVSLLTRIGLQRLVLQFGRRNLIAGSMACAAAGLAWLPFAETPGAFIAMIGLGSRPRHPPTADHVMGRTNNPAGECTAPP